MENDLMFAAPYWRWLDKKLGNKNGPMETLQRRSMNTATTILSTIRNIPFSKLSSTLYFFCSDVSSREFARLYEAQLELAGAAPEKFAKGLHKFYNDISRKIKTENLWEDFFDFISLCGRLRTEVKNPNIDISVVNCYYSLLLQNTEYLRPEKFNLSAVLCGMATTGELLTTVDTYPNLDTPCYELERAVRERKLKSQEDMLEFIRREFFRAGYRDVQSLDDIGYLTNIDRVFSNHIASMLPFINEYTYDMVPTVPFTTLALPFYNLQVVAPSLDALEEMLRKRSAVLPANGMVFKLSENPLVRDVIMKEILYNDRIYMLYKMSTVCGDLSGYYDTKDGYLFSIFLDADDLEPYRNIKAFLLYLYASAVTKNGPKMIDRSPICCRFDNEDKLFSIQIELFGKGGKLKKVYGGEEETHHAPRKGNDAYMEEERAIQGFIRKVGEGKSPSPQAVAYAEELGYELGPDETYVRPFIRRVLKLKRKEN